MKSLFMAIAIVASFSANAEFLTGNMLLERLESQDPFTNGMGLGYVAGVYDVTRGFAHCPPQTITLGQVADMTKMLLNSRPDLRHKTADIFVVLPLRNLFPCPKKGEHGA